MSIWHAAAAGDLAEVKRLVRQEPGLLNAEYGDSGMTPLMLASEKGHLEVVRWLVDKGAALNEQQMFGGTALGMASYCGHPSVVKLLLDRGADPTLTYIGGSTPLMGAASGAHLEIVRLLLRNPIAKETIDFVDDNGHTALYRVCHSGRAGPGAGVVKALLEGGADPTIAANDGTTPMAIAKQVADPRRITGVSAEGRLECVAELEVSCCVARPPSLAPAFG
jgi:uncharacterized protein